MRFQDRKFNSLLTDLTVLSKILRKILLDLRRVLLQHLKKCVEFTLLFVNFLKQANIWLKKIL